VTMEVENAERRMTGENADSRCDQIAMPRR